MFTTPFPKHGLRQAVLAALTLVTCIGVVAHPANLALKDVVISASRSEQLADDLPQSIDIIRAAALESAQLEDIRDAARNLPNVSVKRAPARFGVTGRGNAVGADANAGFIIRGQGGNRVVMLEDGVRLPRSYINGSNAFGRDSVSLGLVKRIEILRGPGSALYGSDALAGLVNFITLEPQDFLRQPDGSLRDSGGKAWLGYSGDDRGRSVGSTVAWRAGAQTEWSLTATARRAEGMDNLGNNDASHVDRTTPNPQQDSSQSLLGKLVWRPDSDQRHVLTLAHIHKDSVIDLLSSRAKPPYLGSAAVRAALVTRENANSDSKRTRAMWDASYQLDHAWADRVRTVLSWQASEAQQAGQTARLDGGLRLRDARYSERSVQAGVQASKTLPLGGDWEQTLSYGLDLVQSDVASHVEGHDPAPLPAFTARNYFPDTRDSAQALYVQTELGNPRWRITPGLRLDQFALDVRSQAGYYPGLSTTPGAALSGSALSPKLGVLFRAAPQWSVYANYASGFRAPESQQVNSALELLTVKLLPNPDLKPEKSRHIELGLRHRGERLSLDMALFYGKYTDLIQEKKDLGTANGLPASSSNPTLFQTVNIDRASIKGFEFHGRWQWGALAGGQLSSPFAFGKTRGRNDINGLPLSSIEPAHLLLGLKYETIDWDLVLDIHHHASKDPSELESPFIPKSTTLQQFTTPAATTLDLHGQWRLRRDIRLNLGINNLGNKKYWLWSDVQGLAANPAAPLLPVLDAYTQPGRHVNISLVMDF